jgi:hypothetical protein
MLIRSTILAFAFVFLSISVAEANDIDVFARALNVDPQFLVMNVPPRPDVWPGAIFTSNLRIPIVHGEPNDKAIHRGDPIQVDSHSAFDLSGDVHGGWSYFVSASADAKDVVNVTLSFPEARVNDMDLASLKEHILKSTETIAAAKLGQIPLIVTKTYSGVPKITISKKANASGEAWAKAKKDIRIGAAIGVANGEEVIYTGKGEITFAFETQQIVFDPKSLNKGVYVIQLAAVPHELFEFRENGTSMLAEAPNSDLLIGAIIGTFEVNYPVRAVSQKKLNGWVDLKKLFQ